jgi:hypothetical protein
LVMFWLMLAIFAVLAIWIASTVITHHGAKGLGRCRWPATPGHRKMSRFMGGENVPWCGR